MSITFQQDCASPKRQIKTYWFPDGEKYIYEIAFQSKLFISSTFKRFSAYSPVNGPFPSVWDMLFGAGYDYDKHHYQPWLTMYGTRSSEYTIGVS